MPGRFALSAVPGAERTLPPHHADPFDRMLVAQARLEDLILVTADAAIGRYDVRTLPAARWLIRS